MAINTWRETAGHNTARRFFMLSLQTTTSEQFPLLSRLVTSSATTFATRILRDRTHWWKKRAQTHFFRSYRCLFNLCAVLLFTGFHIYPHAEWHIQSPPFPSCWFHSCPFLSGFNPKASVRDRIILRAVINCIFFLLLHSASCTVCRSSFLQDQTQQSVSKTYSDY